MYHRISVLVPVLVRVLVHEYEYNYYQYHFGSHEYEYSKSTRNSVLWVWVPSTSTPAMLVINMFKTPKMSKKSHKQVINNKFSETVFRTFYNTLFMSIKRLKKNSFFFNSIKPLYCIIINVWAFDYKHIIVTMISSYLWVITIIVVNCLKLALYTNLGHSLWRVLS